MKIALAIGTLVLAVLWTGFIGLSVALADWLASQGGQLQGSLQAIAQWPLPPWVALWIDPATADAMRAVMVWSVELLTALMPWILPLMDWVAPLLWLIWALGVLVLLACAALGLLVIGRLRQHRRVPSPRYAD